VRPNFAPPPATVAAGLPSAGPSESLELPPPWNPPARPAVPLLASVVPVLGAVALWLVTGSLLSLWLTALGPVIAGATVLDGIRGARRERRRAEERSRAAREHVSAEVSARHDDERRARWMRHPDVAAFVARDGEIWRPVSGRGEVIVLGSGIDASEVRVIGGGDDAASVDLRARAALVPDVPIVASPALGIAVVGSAVLAGAVVRALVLQLAMTLPPGELRIVGALRGEDTWAERLPHRRASHGTTLCLASTSDAHAADADIVIVRLDPGEPRPPGCAIVLTARTPDRSLVDVGGEVREIGVEALGMRQAEMLADGLAERAGRVFHVAEGTDPVALDTLLPDAPGAAHGHLPAVIGVESGDPFVVDLVADGPHAVVAGVTGSGKSELLITWIVALCASHSTSEVTFLLADFKGGTAFDSLSTVPHVTGVITDLDGSGARRAIESLRAEVRWREGELARAGARDILDPRVELPRLVIVVDEFAALLGEHPELHAVFTDVAARGRALGMHLVLGTQRPSGVVRESLLANCPLRISLRVTDPADSRAIVGTDAAASLPGGLDGRGLALVRTAADSSARRVRIALSSTADAASISAAHAGTRPRRPWLPELPGRLDLEELVAASSEPDDTILIGLADEPELQRQRPIGVRPDQRGLLVVGTGGSGKSSALRTVVAQAGQWVVWVPDTPEGAWDAVAELVDGSIAIGRVIVIDDLDALVAALPPDYAREFVERLERLIRSAGASRTLVVVSAQRIGGAVARVSELLPHRLVLAASSRAEHIAVGGDAAHYAPGSPPGRGRLDGRPVQVAMTASMRVAQRDETTQWHPDGALTGFVMRRSPGSRATLAAWETAGARVLSVEEFVGAAEWGSIGPIVVRGEVEDWQRHWRALTTVRADHDLVVDASCGPEFRLVTGDRELPPYCDAGRGRAWLMRAGAGPVRIVLPVS
jgi:DNA segregation ATPase FtsK/SpoIIIE, S-DNA-T family